MAALTTRTGSTRLTRLLAHLLTGPCSGYWCCHISVGTVVTHQFSVLFRKTSLIIHE